MTTEIATTQAPTQLQTVFDSHPAEFKSALERREQNWKALLIWIKSNLIEGEDFYKLKLGGRETKPALSKAGAEKICSLLGITAHFQNADKWEQLLMEGQEIKQVIIRCQLKSSGKTIAEGMGARSLTQDKNDLNKCLKMAEKSAFIDAVIRCAAVNSVFTQDLEDLQTEPASSAAADYTSQIETAIHNAARQHGLDADSFKERVIAYCHKRFHLLNFYISATQCAEIINLIPRFAHIAKTEG